MKKLFLVALAAVGLASCVQNEELAVAGGNVAIAFGDSYVHNATKADPTTTTGTIAGFDVWAFMDEVGGSVLVDEDVTKSGGAWGYANIQYWAPNHTYYFAALSPMNSANVTETLAGGDAAKLGLGEIAFTNAAGTEDLLYAKEKVTTPATLSELTAQGMDAVEMEFQHLLSKVKFTFQNGFGTSNMTVQVSDVAMKVANNAKINLAVADYSKGWTGHAGETVLAFGDTEILASAATGAAADERLTIPADATANYEVTFNVQVWSGSILALETAKTATISGYALEMGKAYNFTAVINNETLALPAIEFTATVNGWDNVGDVAAYKWENDGFGLDTLTGIYHVTNLAGLDYFAAQVNDGRDFAGETVKLSTDIDLLQLDANGEPVCFVPIGSYRDDKAFSGTFDGQNHTIKNLNQNTWALDCGYYYTNLGMGLFSKVKDATIKDLKIDNANLSGESAMCGIVAGCAYGDMTFENITVTNSKCADYQYYAGGIVGWASGNHTYKNCNIDASTTIGGQWGDFGNSNGGVIGGASASAKILLEDCNVACRIDAHNDVVSSYQWYIYRCCGMLIGNTNATKTVDGRNYADAPQLTCKNVTVTYGDWANYTYCQFSAMGQYPWVRVQAGISCDAYINVRYGHPTDANGNTVVDDNHVHNDGEGHHVLIEFDQLLGGGPNGDGRNPVYGTKTFEGVTVIYNNK